MNNRNKIRTYSELIKLKTFEERFNYLKLNSKVGMATFGGERYINQKFYTSDEWKSIRNDIIIRDNGCDLGIEEYNLGNSSIYIHHMNPILVDDLIDYTEYLMNPEYLICCSNLTHNCIHYGANGYIPHEENKIIERRPNDTSPWRV